MSPSSGIKREIEWIVEFQTTGASIFVKTSRSIGKEKIMRIHDIQ